MDKNKLNRIAAIGAIISGAVVVFLSFLVKSPNEDWSAVFDWRFFSGILFVIVGIWSLRRGRS